jgi:hypothetical protein
MHLKAQNSADLVGAAFNGPYPIDALENSASELDARGRQIQATRC